MLTAIMSFAQAGFQEEIGGLRQFEIGSKTVALERSEHVYVAAIGSGPIRNRLSTSLRDFLADIEERYGDRLQWWSGMNEDLLGIDAMVQLFARRERYHRGDWKRHAAAEPEPIVEQPEGPGPVIRVVIVAKEPRSRDANARRHAGTERAGPRRRKGLRAFTRSDTRPSTTAAMPAASEKSANRSPRANESRVRRNEPSGVATESNPSTPPCPANARAVREPIRRKLMT